jgi:phosphoglycolate phosphatase
MIMDLHNAGFRMGILSSNSADNVKQFVERFELSKCFEFIEAGVSLFGKTRRIKSVLKSSGVDAKNAIYVGDETRDMESARKANVSALAVCWGANSQEAMMNEHPAYCIENPDDLIGCAEEFSAAS